MWRRVSAWAGALIERSRMESEMDREMRFHLEAYAEDLVRGGMAETEALRRARVEFGGVEKTKEECRDARGVNLVETFVQDLRFGARMLGKNPGFTAVAVLTLALGIGANAAIFTVINAILLRPLPVEHPAQLVAVGDPARVHSWSTGTPRTDSFSLPLYRQLVDENEVFSSVLAATNLESPRIVIDGGLEPVTGRVVTGNYFETLGVRAIAGRTFTREEDRVPGGDPVAVISHSYWQRRFAASPGVVGRTVRLNDVPFTVIGVTEPGFFGEVVGDRADLWVPMSMAQIVMPGRRVESPNDSALLLIGRLKPGVTIRQAKANIDALTKRALTVSLRGRLSADDRNAVDKMRVDVLVSPGGRGLSRLREEFSLPLLLLMGMVALVLVVACINVANLLLARSAARQREMAVRFAMGAGTARVVRQLLTESLLLACLGGSLGLLVAKWEAAGLVRLADRTRGVGSLLSLDWRVLGFTAAVCLLAAVLFGLGPALRFLRVKVGTALKEGGRDSGLRPGARGRRLLLGAQIAVGVFVLMMAGLLVRSLRNLEDQDLGYNRSRLLLARVDTGASGFTNEATQGLIRTLLVRLGALPGVAGVTASSNGLYSGNESADAIRLDGALPASLGDNDTADDEIGPNYFSTIGVPMVLGREITAEDYSTGAHVAVVNEAFARFYYGDRNPVGHAISILDSDHPDIPPYTIVGVAQDVRDHSVRESARRRMYAPLSSSIFDLFGSVNFEIRTENPAALVNSVRSAIRDTNPQLVIDSVQTANELVGDTLNSQVLVARLSALFGGLVLVLVSIGLYGSMAYNVAMRTKEIGLRMALGIPRIAVLWMVAREACAVLLIGMAVGIPAGIAGSRLFRAMLFGVGGSDPVSIAWAILLLAAVCLAAAILPARRATRVEPMAALRHE